MPTCRQPRQRRRSRPWPMTFLGRWPSRSRRRLGGASTHARRGDFEPGMAPRGKDDGQSSSGPARHNALSSKMRFIGIGAPGAPTRRGDTHFVGVVSEADD
jgi:hypothetical protein